MGKCKKEKPNNNKHGKRYLTSLVHVNTNGPKAEIWSHLSYQN